MKFIKKDDDENRQYENIYLVIDYAIEDAGSIYYENEPNTQKQIEVLVEIVGFLAKKLSDEDQKKLAEILNYEVSNG